MDKIMLILGGLNSGILLYPNSLLYNIFYPTATTFLCIKWFSMFINVLTKWSVNWCRQFRDVDGVEEYVLLICISEIHSLCIKITHLWVLLLSFMALWIAFLRRGIIIYIYIFFFDGPNIDRGCLLEPPQWGGSNEHPQSIFVENKRNNVYPCKPHFHLYRVGLQGWCCLNGPVNIMHARIPLSQLLPLPCELWYRERWQQI